MNASVAQPKVLVTGGLGFIGANVVRRLHHNFDLVVLDWNHSVETEQEFRRLGITTHHGDIADPAIWKQVEKCDYVFHAAAQVSAVASAGDPVRDFQSNAFGTFLVAEYARTHSAPVIYCNSIRIYDSDAVATAMQQKGAVAEDCPTVAHSRNPEPPFAISKLVGEEYLLRYARMYSIPIISLRMSGVTGPGQIGSEIHGWVSHLVGCAIDGRTFTVYGDGKQSRDVLHILDFVDLIEMALTQFDRLSIDGGAVYNVGGGTANELSIDEVVATLRTQYGLDIKLVYGTARAAEPMHYVSDCGLIAAKGWRPTPTDPNVLIGEMVDRYVRRNVHETRTP